MIPLIRTFNFLHGSHIRKILNPLLTRLNVIEKRFEGDREQLQVVGKLD
jgi:hypothetical protein